MQFRWWSTLFDIRSVFPITQTPMAPSGRYRPQFIALSALAWEFQLVYASATKMSTEQPAHQRISGAFKAHLRWRSGGAPRRRLCWHSC
jgi:hypothetical protein